MKSRNNQADLVGATTSSLLENIKKFRELDRKRLDQALKQAGGPKRLLESRWPNLARTAPETLSAAAVTQTTSNDLSDAERRLQGCAMCPPDGGQCATDHAGHPKGQQPSFQTGRLIFSSCTRWPEYKIRKRLTAAGVPPRLSGLEIKDASHLVSEESLEELRGFIRAFSAAKAPSLLLVGESSNLVAVATLRHLAKVNHSITMRYDRAPALNIPLKQYFAKPEGPGPLGEFDTAKVGVIVELKATDSAWLSDHIRERTYTRFIHNKTTIVASVNSESYNIKEECAKYFGEAVFACITTQG